MTNETETITTSIWLENEDQSNPYAPSACYCAGYDVFGDLLGKASWAQYIYLLFKQELPNKRQARLLELVAIAIANPGIRDHSVRAAMNAGVGGSTHASSLIAALAVGAGNLGGGREIHQMARLWRTLDCDLSLWTEYIKNFDGTDEVDVWLPMEHIPGFDPNGLTCAKPNLQTLEIFADSFPGHRLSWLMSNRNALEALTGYPLSMAGVIATAFSDLEFDDSESEMLFLLLRLPGAAAHALEQEKLGWRKYPFFKDTLASMPKDDYKEFLNGLGD